MVQNMATKKDILDQIETALGSSGTHQIAESMFIVLQKNNYLTLDIKGFYWINEIRDIPEDTWLKMLEQAKIQLKARKKGYLLQNDQEKTIKLSEIPLITQKDGKMVLAKDSKIDDTIFSKITISAPKDAQPLAWEAWKDKVIDYFKNLDEDEPNEDDVEVEEEEQSQGYLLLKVGLMDEYRVFNMYENAEKYAIAQVKDDLQTDPTSFSPDWFKNYLTIGETDKNLMINNEINSLWHEKENSESDLKELAEEFELETEFAYFFEEEKEDVDLADLQAKTKEDLIAKIHDKFDAQIRTRWEEGLENPYQFFVEDEGIYTEKELLKASFISIDYDEASKDAVASDGVARYLASYDDEQIKLDEELGYAYRIN
jgi:hypothetical protein